MTGIWAHIFIFIIGVVAGLLGIVIGGGSLFTIPALMLVGLPPHVAVATNRLGAVGLMLAGTITYHRKKLIDYRIAGVIACATTVGAIGGSYLMMAVNAVSMKYVVLTLTVLLLGLMFLDPKRGLARVEKRIRKRHMIVGSILSCALGVYGAFYGANVATFMIYVQVYLFGKTFIEGSATNTLAMTTFSIVAAAIFMAHGLVDYPFAITMFVGMAIGSAVSAHNVEKISNRWVQRAILALTIVMVVLLLKK